jgi:hypothetical protein
MMETDRDHRISKMSIRSQGLEMSDLVPLFFTFNETKLNSQSVKVVNLASTRGKLSMGLFWSKIYFLLL